MVNTKLGELSRLGQSIWLDNISRSMIESGRLKEMVGKGLRGLTSNPSIFDKAISLSGDYDKKISGLKSKGLSGVEIYDELSMADVRDAADIFLPIYDETRGFDGYVSLEVDPGLAQDIENSVAEGKRLFKRVSRPNLMIKVPGTDAGVEVVERLISEGINVNATLIFSIDQYTKVSSAFLKGMANLVRSKPDLVNKVHSVASVFVSRVDTHIDQRLKQLLAAEKTAQIKDKLKSLLGAAAVANSRLILKKHTDIFSSQDFRSLEDKGASIQRLVWASTSTKNPEYSDIKYVSELMYKNTVNTLPEETLAAFLDHGEISKNLSVDDAGSLGIIRDLREFGIDIEEVCSNLLNQGIVSFEKSFRSLMNSIDSKTQSLLAKA